MATGQRGKVRAMVEASRVCNDRAPDPQGTPTPMSQAGTARARVFAPVPLLSILALLALVLAAGYARSRSHVVVGFSAYSASPARLQLFHDVAGRFLEARSDWITLEGPGRKTESKPVDRAEAMQ
jgi:hypothetical protein